MKKFLATVSTVLLIAILAFTMAGCDNSGNIKKAFENEGYTVTSVKADSSEAKGLFTLMGFSEKQVKEAEKYEIIYCVKGISACMIIKFPSEGDLKEFLTVEKDGNKDTAAYDKAKENDEINGNCLFIGTGSSKDIFKKA